MVLISAVHSRTAVHLAAKIPLELVSQDLDAKEAGVDRAENTTRESKTGARRHQ